MATTTARSKPAASPRRKAPTAKASAPRAEGTATLPDWTALGGTSTARVARAPGRDVGGTRQAERRAAAKRHVRALDAVPSVRTGLLAVLACLVVTLFVSHVYATRATLDGLQDARRENERLRLSNQRLSGAFDRMTAPDRVMPRALAFGLVEGIAYGAPITLDAEQLLD